MDSATKLKMDKAAEDLGRFFELMHRSVSAVAAYADLEDLDEVRLHHVVDLCAMLMVQADIRGADVPQMMDDILALIGQTRAALSKIVQPVDEAIESGEVSEMDAVMAVGEAFMNVSG